MLLHTQTEHDSTIFQVISDEKTWGSIVAECDLVDFYHTFSYHRLSSINDEKPILICYRANNNMIALPLLLRNIVNTDYFDATSVYGYPGPITKGTPTAKEYGAFQRHLKDYCIKENIVSIFSRLNSFIPFQENCLFGLGSIETLGKSVYLDLSQEEMVQLSQYHRRLRTYINKSRKLYEIKLGSSKNDTKTFMKLYLENMERVKANEIYYFSEDYFHNLMDSKEVETTLMLAYDQETKEVAGGAIFIKHGLFVQYHLSGVKEEFLRLNPVKLMIDEMRKMAAENGCCYFNLGGGVGGKEDSLYYFKTGYSKEFMPFKIWKFIAIPNIYNKFLQESGNYKTDFFPGYRIKRY